MKICTKKTYLHPSPRTWGRSRLTTFFRHTRRLIENLGRPAGFLDFQTLTGVTGNNPREHLIHSLNKAALGKRNAGITKTRVLRGYRRKKTGYRIQSRVGERTWLKKTWLQKKKNLATEAEKPGNRTQVQQGKPGCRRTSTRNAKLPRRNAPRVKTIATQTSREISGAAAKRIRKKIRFAAQSPPPSPAIS